MYKQYKKTRKISKIKKSIVSALFLSGMLLLLTRLRHVTSEDEGEQGERHRPHGKR